MGKGIRRRKAVLKRIKITGKKKTMCRALGLGHFNAKKSGDTKRGKKKALSINTKKVKKVLPFI